MKIYIYMLINECLVASSALSPKFLYHHFWNPTTRPWAQLLKQLISSEYMLVLGCYRKIPNSCDTEQQPQRLISIVKLVMECKSAGIHSEARMVVIKKWELPVQNQIIKQWVNVPRPNGTDSIGHRWPITPTSQIWWGKQNLKCRTNRPVHRNKKVRLRSQLLSIPWGWTLKIMPPG